MTQQYQNPLPVDWSPSSGIGKRLDPVYGKPGTHKGVDLPVVAGTPVYAAARRKIIVSQFEKDGFGQYIAIAHYDPNDENKIISVTKYAHLTEGPSLVKEGDWVETGQQIGLSGSSGKSTGPHLHFEIREGRFDGNVINPLEVTNRTPHIEKAHEITESFFSKFTPPIASEIRDLISGFSQTKLGDFISNLFESDPIGTPKAMTISGQDKNGVNQSYTVKTGDTVAKIAQSLHTTVDALLETPGNEYLRDRTSADGRFILIRPGDKIIGPNGNHDSLKIHEADGTQRILNFETQTGSIYTPLNKAWEIKPLDQQISDYFNMNLV